MPEDQDQNFYHLMLRLPKEVTAPDHYQLLGLEYFESDAETIHQAAVERNIQLRAWDNSKFYEIADQITDEVVLAEMLLQDSERKAQYDEQLRRELRIEPRSEHLQDDLADKDSDDNASVAFEPPLAGTRTAPSPSPRVKPKQRDFDKLVLRIILGSVLTVALFILADYGIGRWRSDVVSGEAASQPASPFAPKPAQSVTLKLARIMHGNCRVCAASPYLMVCYVRQSLDVGETLCLATIGLRNTPQSRQPYSTHPT